MSVSLVKVFDAPPVDQGEILRYLGQKERDDKVDALVKECLDEVEKSLTYKACYIYENCKISSDEVEIGGEKIASKSLAKNLSGVNEVVLFACSVGFTIDRLIEKYKVLNPTKSLVMHAVGVERVESLANAFCSFLGAEVKKENKRLRPRFSPGYGDFGIEGQNLFFKNLEVNKLLGVTLTEGMLMSPSKSVTAIVGIGDEKEQGCNIGCESCSLECEYRR